MSSHGNLPTATHRFGQDRLSHNGAMSKPTLLTLLAKEPVREGYYDELRAAVSDALEHPLQGVCLGPDCTALIVTRRSEVPARYFCSKSCADTFIEQRAATVSAARRLFLEVAMAKKRQVDKTLIRELQLLHTATTSLLNTRFPGIPRPRDAVAGTPPKSANCV